MDGDACALQPVKVEPSRALVQSEPVEPIVIVEGSEGRILGDRKEDAIKRAFRSNQYRRLMGAFLELTDYANSLRQLLPDAPPVPTEAGFPEEAQDKAFFYYAQSGKRGPKKVSAETAETTPVAPLPPQRQGRSRGRGQTGVETTPVAPLPPQRKGRSRGRGQAGAETTPVAPLPPQRKRRSRGASSTSRVRNARPREKRLPTQDKACDTTAARSGPKSLAAARSGQNFTGS